MSGPVSTPREPAAVVCAVGCCPGCQDCYGMSLGCHQDPCRCDRPCTCRWKDEDADRPWRDGCERHDATEDRRGEWMRVEPDDDDLRAASSHLDACPECGQVGACGYDDEGRALIHAIGDEA